MIAKKTLQRWLTQVPNRTDFVRKYIEKCPESTAKEAIAVLTKLNADLTPELIRGVYYREKDRAEKKAKKEAKVELVRNMKAKFPDATYADLAKALKGKVNYGFISRTLGYDNYVKKTPKPDPRQRPEKTTIKLVNSPFDKFQVAKQFVDTIGGLDQAIELLQTIKSMQ